MTDVEVALKHFDLLKDFRDGLQSESYPDEQFNILSEFEKEHSTILALRHNA